MKIFSLREHNENGVGAHQAKRNFYFSLHIGSILLFLGLTTQTVFGQGRLSFSEAQSLMFKENKELKTKQQLIETSNFDFKTAKSLSYPRLSGIGAATWMDKEVQADLNGLKGIVGHYAGLDPASLGDWNFTLQKRDIEFVGATFAWPVYAGGKIKYIQQAADINRLVKKKDKEISEQQLISELAERYFQTKLAEEAIKVREFVLNGMQQHLYNAKKMEANGIVANAETLQAKVAVANAERELMAIKKDWEIAKDALANTIGIDSISGMLSTTFFLPASLLPLNEYQAKAVDNYPQIEKLKLLEKLSDKNILLHRADHLPTVSLIGEKVFASRNFPLVKNPFMGGVTVTFDLFNGWSTKNKILSAQSDRKALEFTREKAQEDVGTYVDNFYKRLEKDQEQMDALKVSISLAEELLRVRTKGFAEGMASSVDVVDAELNLSSVKLQQLQANCDYITTLAKLYELCGISNQFAQLIP